MIIEDDFISPYLAGVLIGFRENTAKIKKNRDLMIDNFGVTESKLIKRSRINEFLENHTSLAELRDIVISITGTKANSFTTKYKNVFKTLKITPIYFSNKLNCIYLKNKDYEKAIEYFKKLAKHPESKLFYKMEILPILGIVEKNNRLEKLIGEYGLEPYIQSGPIQFYHESVLQKLKMIQTREISEFSQKYISVREVAAILNVPTSTVYGWISRNEIKVVTPPLITKIRNNEYSGRSSFIPKDVAKEYLSEVEFKRNLKELFIEYNVDWDAFKTYEKLIELYGYNFTSRAKMTDHYWSLFVKTKIKSTQKNDLKGFVHQLVLITGYLAEMVNASSKELFNFSSEEINKSLLSESVPYTYKEKYYAFINAIHQEVIKVDAPKIFDMEKIRSPKKERKKNHVPKEKVIYKPEVFVELIKYCSNEIEYHKKIAIKDARLYGQSEYTAFSNMWLYVILHLTNTWRHSDVVDFPRLEGLYQGKTLDWLENYDLTNDEAEIIVAYYENHSYFHSKNNKPRYFILSKDLKIPFATAVLICEFIHREFRNPILGTDGGFRSCLIDFGNFSNHPSATTHKTFFNNFKYNIQFENRKMNWTVTTLAADVIRKLTGRNPLEIAKFLRNHSDEEITNIYIQLPQEYINFIAKQLFDLGSFGYIYDAMAQIMFDDTRTPLDFTGALAIKEAFGDPEIIEGISKYLSALSKDQDFVINVLKETTTEEVAERMTYLKGGLMPSKKMEYQCLVGVSNCSYRERDCDICHLSIPNRLAVCKIGLDIHETIDEISRNYIQTPHEAEKLRLAIKFYRQREFLLTAISKFGRDVVNQLVPNGLDAINNKLDMMPETKDLVPKVYKEFLKEEGIGIGTST
ncbi:helix-turn-helix domain-containing protein [Peribacillus simplex]|uniref:helix-turn-helix domain-containing protein n=1 Tax=Peribacillus simplex TaxID=1478 RepID=UPI00119E1877|nr:helix-turn-helix domain-containing protein [Peribacillus simplex]